ncbi:hypothetical protein COBT_001285 [Conglomerata obtusa]
MEEYDFIIKHKPGRNNLVADSLSRNPADTQINEIKTFNDIPKYLKIEDEEKHNLITEHHIDIGHVNSLSIYNLRIQQYFGMECVKMFIYV